MKGTKTFNAEVVIGALLIILGFFTLALCGFVNLCIWVVRWGKGAQAIAEDTAKEVAKEAVKGKATKTTTRKRNRRAPAGKATNAERLPGIVGLVTELANGGNITSSLYEAGETANDVRALMQGDIVRRLIRKRIWRHGTKSIHKVSRFLNLQ